MSEQLTIQPTEHHISIRLPDGDVWEHLKTTAKGLQERFGSQHIGESTVARAIIEQSVTLAENLTAPPISELVEGYLKERRAANAKTRAELAAKRKAAEPEARIAAMSAQIAELTKMVEGLKRDMPMQLIGGCSDTTAYEEVKA